MELRNKTILLTGASSGIGKEIAKKLAVYDCRLFLLAGRTYLIEEYLKRLPEVTADINIIPNDVSDKADVGKCFDEITKIIKEKYTDEGIDIAILNAGIDSKISPGNFNSEAAEKIFGVNYFGIVYWIEKLMPSFMKNKKGMIVGVSSLADNRGYGGSGFYCSSKAAVSIFLEGLRLELIPYGINVITVKPGFVKTPMTDKNDFKMPFLMNPGKAAGIILKGIKKEKRLIRFPIPTVIGSYIIGLLPGRFYEFLSRKLR